MNHSTSYLSTVTLSLFLVNLVPAPFLDGAEILRAVGELRKGANTDEYDLEGLVAIQRPVLATLSASSIPHRLETAVAWASTGLLLAVVVLSLVRTNTFAQT